VCVSLMRAFSFRYTNLEYQSRTTTFIVFASYAVGLVDGACSASNHAINPTRSALLATVRW